MKKTIDFLAALAANNNKPWFDGHKSLYMEAKTEWDAFAMRFLAGVEQFDQRVSGLQLKDITYRIYRDLRFTQDKRPYKWHFGTYVCPGGKTPGLGGYYIHVEPATDTYLLCGGLYNPDKATLKSIREEVMLEPEAFHAALAPCPDFLLPWETALRKVPRDYSPEDMHSEYYRLRSFELCKRITKEEVLSEDFLTNALSALARTQPFTEILNRCFEYAHSED